MIISVKNSNYFIRAILQCVLKLFKHYDIHEKINQFWLARNESISHVKRMQICSMSVDYKQASQVYMLITIFTIFSKRKTNWFQQAVFFYGKTHFPYNERRNESWLLFRKRKKPVYINLLVLKEGNWFFEVLRIQRKKKQMKVSESNSKVVCVSQGAGAKRYFQSETD